MIKSSGLSPEASTQLKLLHCLEALLKAHDWYYTYSDDLKAFNTGRTERAMIYRKVAKIGAEALLRYNLEAPDTMQLHSIDDIPKGMR